MHRREPTDDPNGEAVQGDPAETGAFIYTFAFRLPFRMGISDNFGQEISWPAEYAKAEDAQTLVGPRLYEQWVSLEPPALLIDENRADSAYAFHRCLSGLNVYLQAFALARDDRCGRSVLGNSGP